MVAGVWLSVLVNQVLFKVPVDVSNSDWFIEESVVVFGVNVATTTLQKGAMNVVITIIAHHLLICKTTCSALSHSIVPIHLSFVLHHNVLRSQGEPHYKVI